jgi:catechol 2,3-dioxygenase-like lactoylglutathione lyase family enzyme
MLRPKALDHVGLKVTDMEKSLHFYQALGLELLRTAGPNADGGRSAVLKVGDQEINVFYHSDFVSADKETPAGVDHFCFSMEAASVDQLIGDLRHAGIDIVKGPVERRDGTSVFVYDPDGVHVELRVENQTAANGRR